MEPWFIEHSTQAAFSPWDPGFPTPFLAWASEQGCTADLYGRASHWYSPEINELRREHWSSDETIGWLSDSMQLLRRFWDIIPFLDAVCATGSLDHRPGAVQGLVETIPGLAAYGVKFLQGDLLELYAVAGDPARALSLRRFAAVGPALRKAVRSVGLFRARNAHLSDAAVQRMSLLLVRHLFYILVTSARQQTCAVGSAIARLLMLRACRFPDRARVFDLQDVQCKVCTWVMALGEGTWFKQWRSVAVVLSAALSGVLIGASKKRNLFAVSRPSRSKIAATPASRMALSQLRILLPVHDCKRQGVSGIKALDLARLFGVSGPDTAVARADLTTSHTILVPGTVGRLVLDTVGAAELLLNLPNTGQIRKVKNHCARVLARHAEAPAKKNGAKGIAPWLLRLAQNADTVFTHAVAADS